MKDRKYNTHSWTEKQRNRQDQRATEKTACSQQTERQIDRYRDIKTEIQKDLHT